MLWYNHSFAEMLLWIGTVFQVSDVAHGPSVSFVARVVLRLLDNVWINQRNKNVKFGLTTLFLELQSVQLRIIHTTLTYACF